MKQNLLWEMIISVTLMEGQYTTQFYSADPLWDGAGCGSEYTCCAFNTPPWFYKQLTHPTTDDIEMWVCRNDHNSNEDIAIEINFCPLALSCRLTNNPLVVCIILSNACLCL